MRKAYETLSSETVLSVPIFDIVKEDVRLPNGGTATRYTVEHPGAVVFIPQVDEHTLLMIRQYRHSVRDSILEFPAGTLEENETALSCAKREIVEEVGMSAKEWLELGDLYPTPGFCSEIQHGFVARGLTPDSAPGDEDEIIDVVSMSTEEVEQAIANGGVLDAKSIAYFFRAKLKGLL